MTDIRTKRTRVAFGLTGLCLLAACSVALAQDPAVVPPPPQTPAPAGTWQHFSHPPQNQSAAQPNGGAQASTAYPPQDQAFDQTAAPGPPDGAAPVVDAPPDGPPQYGPPQYGPPSNSTQAQPPPPSIPAQLTLKPGTFVTVRVNQFLSSDRNQPGDAFSASLAQPLVVDGVIVAERGETVGGRVVEAKKAGLVKGVSRLGLELTDLTLVDGEQAPIQTQLTGRNGPTSNGRDAAAVATTTGVGALVGASVARWGDAGTGAAIGAGAGLIVGVAGVLLTRGHPTVIYPEQLLSFRLGAPLTVSTARAPQAFRYTDPSDYNQPVQAQGRPPRPCAGYSCPPPPSYFAYGYGPGYYPYWGPGFGFWGGPGFYGGFYGRGFYGRGFYGRGFGRR